MEYNQLVLQLFGMGFFRADMANQALQCLELMDFKNKERIVETIRRGETQQKELAAMREKLLQLAAVVDSVKGTQLAAALEQEFSDGVGEGRGKQLAARKENAMEKMRRGAQEAVQPR